MSCLSSSLGLWENKSKIIRNWSETESHSDSFKSIPEGFKVNIVTAQKDSWKSDYFDSVRWFCSPTVKRLTGIWLSAEEQREQVFLSHQDFCDFFRTAQFWVIEWGSQKITAWSTLKDEFTVGMSKHLRLVKTDFFTVSSLLVCQQKCST